MPAWPSQIGLLVATIKTAECTADVPQRHVMFVCYFPGVTTHCGRIFHSSVAGFSLLAFEVS
jgi:hypothetical protein